MTTTVMLAGALDVTQVDPADATVQQEWARLAAAAENPFATPEWFESWVHTNPGVRPMVLATHRDGQLVGVAPLVIQRRHGIRVLEAAGSGLADFSGPACKPVDEMAVGAATLRAVLATRGQWDVWHVERCLTGSGWEAAILSAARADELVLGGWLGIRTLVHVPLRAATSPLRRGRDRREIDRLNRRLTEQHGAIFRLSNRDTIDADVRALLALRRSRWANLPAGQQSNFVPELATRTVDSGLLRLWVIEVHGRLIAGLLGWSMNGRTFAYIMAFDANYARFGPGTLLLTHAVLAAHQAGNHTFDFLRGEELQKRSFSTEQRTARSFLLARRRSLPGLAVRTLVASLSTYRLLPPGWREALQVSLPGRLSRSNRQDLDDVA